MSQDLGSGEAPVEYLCECSAPSCPATVSLTRTEYETVRLEGKRFVIHLNHENPEFDVVTQENERWAVIDKLPGAPTRIAETANPRQATSGAYSGAYEEQSALHEPTTGGMLAIRVDKRDATTTLILHGELDTAGLPLLDRWLDKAESDGQDTIVIDLAQLQFMDSTGLNAFIQADKRAKKAGWTLRIKNARGPVLKIFAITRTEFLLENSRSLSNDASRSVL